MRFDNETTKLIPGREYTPTIKIDGVAIPSEINWNTNNSFSTIKD